MKGAFAESWPPRTLPPGLSTRLPRLRDYRPLLGWQKAEVVGLARGTDSARGDRWASPSGKSTPRARLRRREARDAPRPRLRRRKDRTKPARGPGASSG